MNPNDLNMEPGKLVRLMPDPVFEVSIKLLHFQDSGGAIGEQVYLQRVQNLHVGSIVALVNQQIELLAKEG